MIRIRYPLLLISIFTVSTASWWYFFPAKNDSAEMYSQLPPDVAPLPIIKHDPLHWDWNHIDTASLYFPPHFLWGLASSAQQVEGNCTNNDWSIWEKNNADQVTGLACDHWHHYKNDIQLIKKSGARAFRFSIEWSKVEPTQGHFDHNALMHYKEVCQELVKNQIKPIVTLHHYTNPQWFAAKGGFEKENNIADFITFCQTVFATLHPYVHLWITFNSPTSYVARSYLERMAPPGLENMQLTQEVVKNILEAHVQTYNALKKLPGGREARIGITHNIYQVESAGTLDGWTASIADTVFNEAIFTFFKTGVFKVYVPLKASVKHINKNAPHSLDFVGLNYYSHGLIKNFKMQQYPGEIKTLDPYYTIYPEGFYRAIVTISQKLTRPLHIPLYVTENGVATNNEQERELFFQRYLFALSRAIQEGYAVQGYVVWSLMDDYEWGSYNRPYGVYKVDFKTLERTRKGRHGADYLVSVMHQYPSKEYIK